MSSDPIQVKDFLVSELAEIKSQNLYRQTVNHNKANSHLINFSSNDYLGLGSRIFTGAQLYSDPMIIKILSEGKIDFTKEEKIDLKQKDSEQCSLFAQNKVESKESTAFMLNQLGSTGSRLITGTHEIHEKLETFIAEWKHTEAAMLFTSGYLANLGALSALLNPRDVVFSDEYNHACIFDGIRLSRAKKFIYKHNDINHLEELITQHRSQFAKAIIVSDTVFSMDGDKAKLAEISALAKKFNCSVYIDEAHATGVLGSSGSGLVEELVDKSLLKYSDIEIQMGTFSKAVGLEGAYIAGSRDLINYLKNKARTFVYSTAASPLLLNKVYEHLKIIRYSKQLREKLHSNIEFFRGKLKEYQNIDWGNDSTAIFSIAMKTNQHAIESSEQLKLKGFLVLPIRPPTVPNPRLRICISANHSEENINNLVDNLVNLS